MTPQEQYKIDLDRWAIDIAAWQKAEKAWALSLIPEVNQCQNPDPLQGHQCLHQSIGRS